MGLEVSLRTSLFGGYNKADVEKYIEGLESEIKELRQRKPGDSAAEGWQALEEAQKEIEGLSRKLEAAEKQLKEKRTDEMLRREAAPVEPMVHPIMGAGSLEEENAALKQRIMELEKEYRGILDSKLMISRVLLDAKDRADLMLKEADAQAEKTRMEADAQAKKTRMEADEHAEKTRMEADAQARQILDDANTSAQKRLDNVDDELEEKKKVAYEALDKEIQDRVVDFVMAKYRIADYVQGLDTIRDQLTELSQSLQAVSKDFPIKMGNLLESICESDTIEGEYREPEPKVEPKIIETEEENEQ